MSYRPLDGGMVQRIADYACDARNLPLDPAAAEAALRCIFDLLSAVAAGLHDPGSAAVCTVASKIMGQGSSPIWFTGLSGSVVAAAWANSAAAAAQDLDDGHRLAAAIPGLQ